MLKWLKTYWTALVLSALIIAVLDAVISSALTCHPIANQPGSAANGEHQNECTALAGPVLVTLVGIVDFLDRHGEAFTGAFTIILAIFTGRLWYSTEKLWGATNESIQLARAEYISTHRPKIIVRGLVFESVRGDPDLLRVYFVYTNIGDSPAEITSVATQLLEWRGKVIEPSDMDWKYEDIPDEMDALDEMDIDQKKIEIPSGGSRYGLTDDTINQEKFIALSAWEASPLVCVGRIRYRDKNGAVRETGFCRKYDTERYRWVAVDDPEYEYAY
jgi:hypothetical protein